MGKHNIKNLMKHNNPFKSFSHAGKKIGNAIGDVYTDGKHAVSGVYNDTKSAVSYGGKHIIKDVDNVSSTLSNPFVIVGVGAVILVIAMNR